MEFKKFNKIPRLFRPVIITEKLDGTNACIGITQEGGFYIGSRNGWLTSDTPDNFGFRRWALDNKDELLKLGVGTHYGEWWGKGIQRGYELNERRFSLFNTGRWSDDAVRPKCCHAVQTINAVPLISGCGANSTEIAAAIQVLQRHGSYAAPGFMKPEGIIVYHSAGNLLFKVTLDKHDKGKWEH